MNMNIDPTIVAVGGNLGRGLRGLYDDYQNRQTLSALGADLQNEDYAGAARKAFDAGDVNTGLKLIELANTRSADADAYKQMGSLGNLSLSGLGGGVSQASSAPASPGQPMQLPGGRFAGGRQIYDLAIARGAKPNEAALLAAAAGAESNYNPSQVHDNGTGYGLFGHRLDRRSALFNSAGTNRPGTEAQVAFALNELRSRPEGRMALAARSPEELTRAQMFFERPVGFSERNPEGGHNYSGRLALTRQFFQGGGGDGGRVQVADASGRVPLPSAGVGAQPDAEPPQAASGGQQEAILGQINTLYGILGRQNISPQARAAVQSRIHMMETLLSRADRQDTLTENRRLQEEQRQYQRQQFDLSRQDRLDARQEAQANRADTIRRHEEEMQMRREDADPSSKAAARRAAGEKYGLQGEDLDRYALTGQLPSAGEKQTADQANAALYATRMAESNKIISDPSLSGYAASPDSLKDRAADMIPVFGGKFTSEQYKQVDQAQRDFINAALRRESGAAISQSEFENAKKQYFPQPYDPPGIVEQKARNRQTAMEGIANAAIPSFKEKFFGSRTPDITKRAAERSQGSTPAPAPAPAKGGVTPRGTKWSLE